MLRAFGFSFTLSPSTLLNSVEFIQVGFLAFWRGPAGEGALGSLGRASSRGILCGSLFSWVFRIANTKWASILWPNMYLCY